MLSTITPFGERGKGHSYRVTSAWFVAGAAAGGAALGLVMAALAGCVEVLQLSPAVAGAVGLAAALVAAGSDSGFAGIRLPTHGRQVNERWLDRYRPWVYGGGFGWQIGCGLATFITTAAVYLMIVLAALTGSPMVALVVGTGFGVVRGAAVLLTRHLRDPAGLLAFHRRFAALGPTARRVVIGVELGSAALIAAWDRTSSTVAVAVLAALVAVGTLAASARRPWEQESEGAPGRPAPEDAPATTAGSAHPG
jgi:hypothetical protein